jgi:hypothetical protein
VITAIFFAYVPKARRKLQSAVDRERKAKIVGIFIDVILNRGG